MNVQFPRWRRGYKQTSESENRKQINIDDKKYIAKFLADSSRVIVRENAKTCMH